METDPRSGALVLAVNECWALLRTAKVGRLAVVVDGRPDIFPVNFLVDQGTVVVRTGVGTKLDAVLTSPHVAFEADGYDEPAGSAWSVVIKGQGQDVKKMHELLDTVTLPLFPWQAGAKGRFVRLVPDEISGRRFTILDPASWRTSMTDAARAEEE
jgi:nitroimidazol reductase NimA-like FMN-containing flavoprotein (pyridoxamine 5'-phosphate oxidase superfamily)